MLATKLIAELATFSGSPREYIFTKYAHAFNTWGIATTTQGKTIALKIYHLAIQALQKNIQAYAQQTKSDIKIIAVFGSYIKGTARLGIYPPSLSYTEAVRIENDKALLVRLSPMGMDGGSDDYLAYPSDADIVINRKTHAEIKEIEAILCKEIFQKFGIFSTLTPEGKLQELNIPYKPI